MQSRESDAPPTRSERLAKHALYKAQVIYTCMSACHLRTDPWRSRNLPRKGLLQPRTALCVHEPSWWSWQANVNVATWEVSRPCRELHWQRRLPWSAVMETTSTLGECVSACVRACVRDVFAIYDNNISPSLLTIIIKIIIIYFIQIRHTEDFPPTGTPASTDNVACYAVLGLLCHSCFWSAIRCLAETVVMSCLVWK